MGFEPGPLNQDLDAKPTELIWLLTTAFQKLFNIYNMHYILAHKRANRQSIRVRWVVKFSFEPKTNGNYYNS